jgi:hypothetical protein
VGRSRGETCVRENRGEAIPFSRIVVLLDDLGPEQGAFAQALDWAGRLRIPMDVCWSSYSGKAERVCVDNRIGIGSLSAGVSGDADGQDLADATQEPLQTFAAACTRRGVPMDAIKWKGADRLQPPSGLRSTDLVVLSEATPLEQKNAVLRSTAAGAGFSVLTCSQSYLCFRRALVIHPTGHGHADFLRSAVSLCAQIAVQPIILTVGRSERVAQAQQQSARLALGVLGRDAAFDFLVGWDVQASVAKVAHWRGCQFVIIEGEQAPPWRRWLWRSRKDRLIEPNDGLAVLSLDGIGHSSQTRSP